MNRNDHIAAVLRSLDPADQHVDAGGARARADLHAILAVDPTADPGPQPSPALTVARGARRPSTSVRRAALVAGTVAAVTAGLVVLPSATGGDEAFATWTAAPAGMSPQQQAEAVAACRDDLADGPGAEAGDADALAGADPVIAERRGVWTTVVLAGAEGFSATCITDDSAHPFATGMIGSIGAPDDHVAPGPRELIARSLGVGTMSAGDLSMIDGAAGSDVVGVVYRSPTHGDVIATVTEGHFALWFPGDGLRDAHTADGVAVEVTYRDGTTATSRLTL